VFRVSDYVLVPVIPTTLSERTFRQLTDFFEQHNLNKKKLLPFFSMVQKQKNLHKETMDRLRKQNKRFLAGVIPFSSDIEKMGIHRAPVLSYSKSSGASRAYRMLWREIDGKI